MSKVTEQRQKNLKQLLLIKYIIVYGTFFMNHKYCIHIHKRRLAFIYYMVKIFKHKMSSLFETDIQ